MKASEAAGTGHKHPLGFAGREGRGAVTVRSTPVRFRGAGGGDSEKTEVTMGAIFILQKCSVEPMPEHMRTAIIQSPPGSCETGSSGEIMARHQKQLKVMHKPCQCFCFKL